MFLNIKWFANKQAYRISFMLTSAIALGLSSCTSPPTSPVELESSEVEVPTTETTDKLQVVATFLPIAQFTKAVAGDRAEVTQLLPTNVGPHDYQAKPTDAKAIADADILVKNGLELEFFLEDLIENASNQDLVVIDSSEGIPTLSSQEAEGHDHDGDGDHNHDHDHSGDREKSEAHEEAEHHHHGEFDPHIWLDPKRAIAQVENIRDGLITVDPDGEAEYTANATAYIQKLQDLDAEIAERLSPYAGKTFISFHDFAFYFANSYKLNAEFLVDVPEENPSPEDVRRIAEITEAEEIKVLLAEPQAGEDAFASLAKDLEVEVSVFDPIETGDATATDPDYYFTIMRQNVDSLEQAFGESPQSWLFPWMPQPFIAKSKPVSLWF